MDGSCFVSHDAELASVSFMGEISVTTAPLGPMMLDNLSTAVLLFDADLLLLAMNPAAELLLDVSAKQVLGSNAIRVFHDDGLCLDALTRTMNCNRVFMEREMTLSLPDNRSTTVDCTVTPFTDETGGRNALVIRLDIIDDGPGIALELGENIFYPMVTGRSDGTGLGLSIAQSLVGLHDGLIECSRDGGHTIFSILLPLETQQ